MKFIFLITGAVFIAGIALVTVIAEKDPVARSIYYLAEVIAIMTAFVLSAYAKNKNL